MKKLLLSLVTISMAFMLNAQNNYEIKKEHCCGFNKFDQMLNKTNKPVEYQKMFNLKSSKGILVDTIICYDWVVFSASWVVTYMEVNTYDTNGIIEYIKHIWTGTTWGYNEKESYMYDGDGNLTEIINYGWSGGVWENMNRTVFNLSGGMIDEVIFQYWNGSNWVNSMRHVYSYDVNMLIVEIVEYNWKSMGSYWKHSYKRSYSYDGNLNLYEIIVIAWDDNNDIWVNDQKNNYTYDMTGNLVEEVIAYWNGAWENSNRTTYSYDGNGSLLEEIFANWNSGWNQYLKKTYSYDGEGLLSERITYQWALTVWENFEKCVFKYYDEFAGIAEPGILSESINIYPNPVYDNINISSQYPVQVVVSNFQGQILYSSELNGNTIIDTRNWPGGLYFIRSTYKNNIRVDRMIKY